MAAGPRKAVLVGDDYGNYRDVEDAVVECAREHGKSIHVDQVGGCPFWEGPGVPRGEEEGGRGLGSLVGKRREGGRETSQCIALRTRGRGRAGG